jgi:hypothetical protein
VTWWGPIVVADFPVTCYQWPFELKEKQPQWPVPMRYIYDMLQQSSWDAAQGNHVAGFAMPRSGNPILVEFDAACLGRLWNPFMQEDEEVDISKPIERVNRIVELRHLVWRAHLHGRNSI